MVRTRWPGIRHAVTGFHLAAVATWSDERLAALMDAEGMIRNEKKIRATLRNARDLPARSRQVGSALAYLHAFGGDEDALVRDTDTWTHYMGAPSIRWFLRALGATRRRQMRRACIAARRGSRH